MKSRLLSFVVGLCLSFALSAGPAFAQIQEIKPEPELVRQMLQEGWTKVAEGVLQRTEWGQVETFTYGEDGLRWTARKFEARLEFLEKEYASNPTEELAGIIESLESQLVETDEVMKSGAAGAEVVSPDELAACNVTYGATAAADPETGSTGAKANATAYFHADCAQTGSSFAYAYARATAGTVLTTRSQEDPKENGSWLDSAASASAPGSLECYSEAYARSWSPQLSINYEVSDTNFSCQQAIEPVAVSISGPSDVWLDAFCQIVTWHADVSGGTPGYTYQWYLGAGLSPLGTESSFSRKFCQSNQRVDVRVVATDSGNPVQSSQATFTTWIYHEQSCTSGCTCNPPQGVDSPYTCE